MLLYIASSSIIVMMVISKTAYRAVDAATARVIASSETQILDDQ